MVWYGMVWYCAREITLCAECWLFARSQLLLWDEKERDGNVNIMDGNNRAKGI
jgi:hypothetical protein